MHIDNPENLEQLTEEEIKWLKSLDRCFKRAPSSLLHKVSAYTIGDNDLTFFLDEKAEAHNGGNIANDMGDHVVSAGAGLATIKTPFIIDSACG